MFVAIPPSVLAVVWATQLECFLDWKFGTFMVNFTGVGLIVTIWGSQRQRYNKHQIKLQMVTRVTTSMIHPTCSMAYPIWCTATTISCSGQKHSRQSHGNVLRKKDLPKLSDCAARHQTCAMSYERDVSQSWYQPRRLQCFEN